MYRNKKDVDKHVEKLLSKLSAKEFKSRAYSVARLYFEVGDYSSCQKYVEQYLTQKDNNAAAYKLLGQAFQKMGLKEKALEQYKASLDIDPAQTSTILDICELLADNEVIIEPGRAKYWCEKAEATFPRHPVTFRLREKLIAVSNPDPEALVTLLNSELAIRPKDATLHSRLLNHFLNMNKVKEAFEHACNIEFGGKGFINNYGWYEILSDLLKHNAHNTNDWLFQLLLLTVKERICLLSLTETPSGLSKSLVESVDLLHAYDQAIESVTKAGACPGFGEFHNGLLQHHRGQIAFHAATLLLKKAKKDQISWRDATKVSGPLMLVAWQTVPLDTKVNWLRNAPEKQLVAVNRWYSEGAYRCSQAGHYLLANIQDKNHQSFLDQVSQSYSGTHWRDKFYRSLFASKSHLDKIKSSYFGSNAFAQPVLRLPRKSEVESYDGDAQKEFGCSLHHFVWTLLNYKNFANFNCTLFDMLTYNATTCGPETLNKCDIHAFLYCAALTANQVRSKESSYVTSDKPTIIPANITDLLCPLIQVKWWDCAYKFSQNELGSELTDIRATLSRGIEVVRCIDNHGLDPELLCTLGRIFSERATASNNLDEKAQLEIRAGLYYSSAIPLLEKLKNNIMVKYLDKRMFGYTHKDLGTKELNALLEESKLYIAVHHLSEGEYDKVIEILSNLKSPQALYHLSQTYLKIALEENNTSRDSETRSKYATLLTKARMFAYKALDRLKETQNKNHPLYSDTQELIENIEIHLNKVDSDVSAIVNDRDGKYSSEDNISEDSEHLQIRTNSYMFRNISSTPKASNASNNNATNYRTAIDSQILENTRVDQQSLERIENEIKKLQKRDTTISDFMDQTRNWFDENRKLGNQIISSIHSNMQNTTDQFKLLKISVDQVKDQIDECRNECKDVGELKKQVAELKKEVSKLKKASSEQTIDDTDLYNLDEDYQTNDSTSSFATQLSFPQSQVIPPFNQRLVPPFPVPPPYPYQLYNQSLYNLYNQYSQFSQPTATGSQPMFDPRSQVNYSGVYPTPDQMYLDVAHLIPPNVPTVPPVPVVPPVSTIPTKPAVPTVSVAAPSSSVTLPKTTIMDSKEVTRSLPVNVVITSSDPLPTCTTTPAPILSVTIPPKHIKGTPHNYQIAMPTTNDTKVNTPPVFVFPAQNNKTSTTSSSLVSNWNQSSVFKTTPVSSTSTFNSVINPTLTTPKVNDTLDTSKTVVDGLFSGSSPNTSLNKSRTLSERSNTSVENYDPCPDFKPIVPLPAEVKVTTGEEEETIIFSSRAKLFRFVDKQWKERGLGEMKLLKHKTTGKVRVLMRREQIHKICANHIITAEMEITQMKNEAKAYFWVANDFADETVVLEKFCIRFKTADIAQDFYNAFEKARQESMVNKTLSPIAPKTDNAKSLGSEISDANATPSKGTVDKATPKENSVPPEATTTAKAVVGGFTFSSTPTFKPVTDDDPSKLITSKPQDVATSKVNVFSGLSFKTNTSSPFSNLFNPAPAKMEGSNNNTQSSVQDTSKLNNSDTVEEFEPNVEFKPVVPLPALVEQKTGEEDETVLFEHRAKLLRFDPTTKEWKERGLGNIKILVHKDNTQKVRLLMRREQIMKVCCNHAVTNEMIFQKMPNLDKAVTWCAKDFSEGELVAETFCLRFKTIQMCDEFIEAIKSAQTKMTTVTKVNDVKEKQAEKLNNEAFKTENKPSKQNNTTGFGDKFKPKAGSWQCTTCYTNNLENYTKCACCETPQPKSSVPTPAPVNASNNNDKPPVTTVGWGDKFKPKPGSWECKDCFVRNEASLESCSACNSPKDPTKAKAPIKLASDNAPKFNFGIPQKTTSVFGNSSAGPQFRFGISPAANEQQGTDTTSIFDGTGAHKFSFGIPSNAPTSTSGDQKSSALFDIPKTSVEAPVDFSKKIDDNSSGKPALLPTPKTDNTPNSFGFKETGTFDFVFKPKTPTKAKSPAKSDHGAGDDSDGNEYAVEDECHQTFTPVIPLPDKVEVITGEENETELYAQLAKLYRFSSVEWKERGKGIVKILKHKDTGKLRVVMRRDQVLKICMNHALTPEIIYKPKDEKSWLFVVNDFSEGELTLENFCLRFKSIEIAAEFKKAIDEALKGLPPKNDQKDVKLEKKESDESDDVVFVSEIQATSEEKQKAKELMLPENFFTYKNKEPCQGCRGCNESDNSNASSSDSKSDSNTTLTPSTESPALEIKPSKTLANLKATTTSTPVKTTTSIFSSPTNSVYGTPSNLEKTVDTSIFRTPLGSIGSNSKTPIADQNNFGINKENTFIQRPNIFSGFGEQSVKFESSQNKPTSLIGSGDSQTAASLNNSILRQPKLNILNPSNKDTNENSTFRTVPPKFVFSDTKLNIGNSNTGVSSNKSIFEFSKDNKTDAPNTEVKSIFGDDNKSENLFTSVHQGSIFGPGALSNNQSKFGTDTFGSAFGSISQNPVFDAGKSLFSNAASSFGEIASKEQQKVDSTVLSAGGDHKPEEKKSEKIEPVLNADNNLTFAALSSSSGASFNTIQKKPDFQWESAGQQLFAAAQKSGKDKTNNDSGAGDEAGAGDEDYDPHYEPIVPLPDKIVVTTGEEDEEKLFGERCKLYRYDEKTREWKERGVGEMKVLYHPDRKTYRLLLRREQVHKAVLNMLLYMDLELLQMKNSDRAWTWAGRNFAENSAGEQETLAVRFKSVALATAFQEKVVECVRKLQSAAAQAVRDEKESGNVSLLRLPKHLQESARADNAITVEVTQRITATSGQETEAKTESAADDYTPSPVTQLFKQEHFQESEGDHDEDDDEYENDYDGYYNEEEEENAAYYSCDGESIICQGDNETTCSNAHIQVVFDQEVYSPKILVTDSATGEVLADMIIYTDTEFQMSGDSCKWSGTDFTSNDPVDKTVTIKFFDSDTAMQFYDSCETSKAATYASTDPES
ncbi:E3 SUMO-protein ligase RanBP2-like [Trichoplusia ni]|uniref:E3 SUMO-protein ligase RanBP2-like n=1 Tax=Trichoplusia ni TaxID=7111 RepID=A0A7E5VD10_TRINI|nr:E3 SUMO-protein ligase RanBP2-like [Trichoplusia ni]